MPVDRYGVLKGRPAAWRAERRGRSPHFQIRVATGSDNWRVAVNTRSSLAPPDLLYRCIPDFRDPITARLTMLEDGFSEPLRLDPQGGGLSLDYLRQDLAHPDTMQTAPNHAPGRNNDLSDILERKLEACRPDREARLYAFGAAWGPEQRPDRIFGFRPGRGVHDVHMNQGNAGRFRGDNGTWQDGGLLIHLPSRKEWTAFLLAFQSQCWRTHDVSGHCLPD